MDVKRLLTAKNVVVGSIVTVAALLTSIQTIRDNVLRLFPRSAPETAPVKWDTVEDNRTTGQLTLDFYWQGTRDADAPAVKSSSIQGARRVSGDSSLFSAGQRIGRDKWPVTVQREKSGSVWQPVSITVQTDRAGTMQIYIPQEDVASPTEQASKEPPARRASPEKPNVPPSVQPTQPSAPPPTSNPSQRDTLVGSVRSQVEQAALQRLHEILNGSSKPQKIVALEAFIQNPAFAGTAAQKQAEEELRKLVGK